LYLNSDYNICKGADPMMEIMGSLRLFLGKMLITLRIYLAKVTHLL